MPEARQKPHRPAAPRGRAPAPLFAGPEPHTLRLARWAAANGPIIPERDLLSLGVALAPEGVADLKAWAQRALGAAVLVGLLEDDRGSDPRGYRLSAAGRKALLRSERGEGQGGGEDGDHGPMTAAARAGKALRPAEGPGAGGRSALVRERPWAVMQERGALTQEQARAADALDAAAERCEAEGGVSIQEVRVDTSPDHGRREVSKLDRVLALVRLTQGVGGAEWDAVEWVVLQRRSVSSARRGGVALRNSAAGREAFLEDLRRGLDRVALNAG